MTDLNLPDPFASVGEEGDKLVVPPEAAESTPHRAGYVALVGKPNVGKSTLMNAYLGEKLAVVSAKPQTTQRTLRGILTRPDAQVIFVDTPGIHRPQHLLGRYMVRAAVQSVEEVDVIVWLVDGSQMPTREDEEIADILRTRSHAPILLVLNKLDLLKRDRIQEITEAFWKLVNYAEWMRISATDGDNLDKLLEMIIQRLPEGPALFPEEDLTDAPMRELAAEYIREAIVELTRQEVPHSAAVTLEEWQDRSEKLSFLAATIWVEKDSQKGILIGERGSMLKEIGQQARKRIERMVGHSIYLELRVKVRERWRRDERMLREIGYIEVAE